MLTSSPANWRGFPFGGTRGAGCADKIEVFACHRAWLPRVVIGPSIIKAQLAKHTSTSQRHLLQIVAAPLRLTEFFVDATRWDDNAGRDILARVLSGGQISLMVALIATLVSLVIGVSYGALAGYLGGRVDDLMMRIVDVLYSLPYVIIVIVLLALLPAKTPTGQLAQLFFALGAGVVDDGTNCPRPVLSLKNQDFVLAARATGVSRPRYLSTSVPMCLGL